MRAATLSGNVLSAPTHIPYLPRGKMTDGEDWAAGYATNTVGVRREKLPELFVGGV